MMKFVISNARRWVCILGLLLPVLAPASLQAAPVTLSFSGTVFDASGVSGVSSGNSFSGNFTFDSDEAMASSVQPALPYAKSYTFTGAPYGGDVAAGSTAYSFAESNAIVVNNLAFAADFIPGFPGGTYDVFSVAGYSSDFVWSGLGAPVSGVSVGMGIVGDTSLFSDLSLTGMPPSLEDAIGAGFIIEQWDGGVLTGFAYGEVTNTSIVTPVPAAVWLFGSGLVSLLGFAGRARSKKAKI